MRSRVEGPIKIASRPAGIPQFCILIFDFWFFLVLSLVRHLVRRSSCPPKLYAKEDSEDGSLNGGDCGSYLSPGFDNLNFLVRICLEFSA